MSDPDVEKNKLIAILGYLLGYLFPILLIVPLIIAKNSPFARFHANQHIVIFICYIALGVGLVIGSIIVRPLGYIPSLCTFAVFALCYILLFVLSITGIINASRGEMKKLPLIGVFKFIE